MLNKNWFKHGIAAMVILVFALLALGSESTPDVYDKSISMEQQVQVDWINDYICVSFDGKTTGFAGWPHGRVIPPGEHTLVIDYVHVDNQGSKKARGMTIKYTFEPGYHYSLSGRQSNNTITLAITPKGVTKWAVPGPGEGLVILKRKSSMVGALSSVDAYINGKLPFPNFYLDNGEERRLILPNGVYRLGLSSQDEGIEIIVASDQQTYVTTYSLTRGTGSEFTKEK